MKKCIKYIFIISFLIVSSSCQKEYLTINENGIIDNISKSIVYILPSAKASSFWTEQYGDRIFYYSYANLKEDLEFIKQDFQLIASIYQRVIIIIPADDSKQYFTNFFIIDSLAEQIGLKILYGIFPKDKYGEEYTYLIPNSKMYQLVIEDMQFLASLKNTYKIAIWFGWKNHINTEKIIDFYNSLPEKIRDLYAIWLDEEYATKLKKVYNYGLPDSVLIVTEAYDKREIKSYSGLYIKQLLITGYEGSKSLNEWKINIEDLLSVCQTRNIGIWIFYDKNDGSGEDYSALINGNLIDF